MNKHVRVIHFDGRWQIRRQGIRTPISEHRLQGTAVAKARHIAKKKKVELFIHAKDGRISRRDSYGNDPYPPAG